MANHRSALDPRWTSHHVPVVADFMQATIKVYRKAVGTTAAYDFEAGSWNSVATVVYEGKARIQPYGIIGDQIVAQDTTGRRLMRIQIEGHNLGIQIDDSLEVSASPHDPELTKFIMDVRGTIGSSNAWVTDLVCEANLKWKN